MSKILIVGLGGFIGAVLRYGVSGWVHRWWKGALPLGTLTVNVLGCLLIGGLMALMENRYPPTSSVRLFLTIGLLGSFTTFSTLGYETFVCFKEGNIQTGILYVILNVVVGLGAVLAGHFLAKMVLA